jgi:heat shock protein HslJ
MKPPGKLSFVVGLMLCGALMMAVPACGGDDEAQGLEGTKWVLTAYQADGSVQEALPTPPVEATFAGGRVNGTGGCNQYSGSYQVDGHKLFIGLLASTQRACEPAIMDQETAYLKALQSAGSYETGASTLTIKDTSGATVLELHAGKG